MSQNRETDSSELDDAAGATASASAGTRKRHSKKPQYSRFSQQELPACKPILTPGWVITAFVFISVIFIPMGLASLFASEQVVEIVDRYDADCVPNSYSSNMVAYIQSSQTNKTCTKSLTIPKRMKSPVYIYYQLENFYQNHRRYVKNRSDKQYISKQSEQDTEDCTPEDSMGNNAPIVPCGLIAWSLFNDTYGFSVNDKVLNVNKKDIAWKSDREKKFGSNVYPKNFQTRGIIGGAKLNESIPRAGLNGHKLDGAIMRFGTSPCPAGNGEFISPSDLSEQEDLIVWMRTAALPTFRKLYGKIEEDLEANQKLNVVIQNNYNTYVFGGKKRLVLSTTTWVGGKNDFSGIAFLTVGALCLFLAIGFICLYVFRPRPLGDPSYLSWNKNPPTTRD